MTILRNTTDYRKASKAINVMEETQNPDEMITKKMGFNSKNYPEDQKMVISDDFQSMKNSSI